MPLAFRDAESCPNLFQSGSVFLARLHADISKPWKGEEGRQVAIRHSGGPPGIEGFKLCHGPERSERLNPATIGHVEMRYRCQGIERGQIIHP